MKTLHNDYNPIYVKTYVDVYIYVSTTVSIWKDTHQTVNWGYLCDHTIHIALQLTFSQSKMNKKSFYAAHIDVLYSF